MCTSGAAVRGWVHRTSGPLAGRLAVVIRAEPGGFQPQLAIRCRLTPVFQPYSPARRAQMEAVQDGPAGAAAGVRLHRVSIQEWRLYTRAFVLRLPLHRSLPIAFWLALGRLLGWRAPVPQVRRRVIRRAAPQRPRLRLDMSGLDLRSQI
jgi:hypothetical protein